MFLFLASFALAFLMDVVWASYVGSIAAGHPGRASVGSALIVALGGLNVLVFVRSPWSVLAACMGAFCGTYVAVGKAPGAWHHPDR